MEKQEERKAIEIPVLGHRCKPRWARRITGFSDGLGLATFEGDYIAPGSTYTSESEDDIILAYGECRWGANGEFIPVVEVHTPKSGRVHIASGENWKAEITPIIADLLNKAE